MIGSADDQSVLERLRAIQRNVLYLGRPFNRRLARQMIGGRGEGALQTTLKNAISYKLFIYILSE